MPTEVSVIDSSGSAAFCHGNERLQREKSGFVRCPCYTFLCSLLCMFLQLSTYFLGKK